MAERHFLDAQKAELFLRAADDVLEDKFFFFWETELLRAILQMIGGGLKRLLP